MSLHTHTRVLISKPYSLKYFVQVRKGLKNCIIVKNQKLFEEEAHGVSNSFCFLLFQKKMIIK